jgi:phospholipase/carboxylesterase/glyoxalase family protein
VNNIDLHSHRWIPAKAEGEPTLLLLHGTGGNENDLIELGESLRPDAAMLSPLGNVSENGAPRFFRRLAEGVFDVEDLHKRTNELADFIVAASERYGFAPSSVCAVGYSNGANIAASLLLSRPEVLNAALLYRAMVPFESSTPVQLNDKRVLISAGRMDQMIPQAGTERLAKILVDAGAQVELVWQQSSHGLVKGDLVAGERFVSEL